MRAGFKVTTEQGDLAISVTLAELLRWSKTYGHPIAAVQDKASDDQWWEMIWWAATRQGLTELEFMDFAATVEAVERVDSGDPKVTRKARSTGSSSGSK